LSSAVSVCSAAKFETFASRAAPVHLVELGVECWRLQQALAWRQLELLLVVVVKRVPT
jgi:hypothetical protein